MKNIPNKLLVLGLLFIISLNLGILNNNSQKNAVKNEEIPSMAAYGNVDFIISAENYHYELCSRTLMLTVKVASPSNSSPTEVVASLNSTNYTLAPNILTYGNDHSAGVEYAIYIKSLPAGMYDLNLYVRNSTAQTESLWNSVEVTDKPFVYVQGSASQIRNNEYEFTAEVQKYDCATPMTVEVKIDGAMYAMAYNSTRNVYNVTKDFGLDDQTTHYYNFTLKSGSFLEENLDSGSVTTTKVIRKPFLTYNIINSTVVGTKKYVQFVINYRDYEGNVPYHLNISNNFVWSPLPILPWTEYYALSSVQQGYKMVVDYAKGAMLGPYNYTIENGDAKIITVYAKNSTGNETGVYESVDITSGASDWFGIKPNINMVILNSTIFTQDRFRYLDLKFNLTYSGNNLTGALSSVNVYYIAPALGNEVYSTTFTVLAGWSWTYGRTFQGIISLNNESQPWWGDIVFKVRQRANYDLGPVNANNIYWVSSNNVINLTDGDTGKYGVKTEEWNVYNEYTLSRTCCCGLKNTTYREIFKIFGMGHDYGADYFAMQMYYYSYDYKMWCNPAVMSSYDSQTDYFNLKGSSLTFINPSNLSSWCGYTKTKQGYSNYISFPVFIPKSTDFKKMKEYLVSKTAPNMVSLEGKKLTLNNTLTNYDIKYVVEYDSRGVLKQLVFTIKIGDCFTYEGGYKWINKGKGALPKGDGSPIVDGADLWITGFCLVLTSIGLISIILKKRKHNL